MTFKDITPLLADAGGVRAPSSTRWPSTARAAQRRQGRRHRGARLHPRRAPVAYALGVGFVPVRKAGKLPGETVRATYELEYGTADARGARRRLRPGQRVLVVDDVLATGGTAARPTCDLVERAGAEVVAARSVGVASELSASWRPRAARAASRRTCRTAWINRS